MDNVITFKVPARFRLDPDQQSLARRETSINLTGSKNLTISDPEVGIRIKDMPPKIRKLLFNISRDISADHEVMVSVSLNLSTGEWAVDLPNK